MNPRLPELASRIQKHLIVAESGCWLWTGYVSYNGYGKLDWPYKGAKTIGVHRAAYIAWVGDIPEGLVIDHLCFVRNCCNPEHLEAVTNRVNILRSNGGAARNARKTHCPLGHPLTPGNLVPTQPGRVCLVCYRDRMKRYQQKRRDGLRAQGLDNRGLPLLKAPCREGHPMVGPNVVERSDGAFRCRICLSEAAARGWERIRAS